MWLTLAIASNARGSGIVLASLTSTHFSAPSYQPDEAILSSQAAGSWLEYVFRKGWALLSVPAEHRLVVRIN
jgi:hypothetical protein